MVITCGVMIHTGIFNGTTELVLEVFAWALGEAGTLME